MPRHRLRIDHSSRKREIALRQSLIPSLLAVRRHNEAHGNADAELFEIAHVYLPRPDQPLPDEPTRLALVSGRDFRGLKGIVEALLAAAAHRRTSDGTARGDSPLRPRPRRRAAAGRDSPGLPGRGRSRPARGVRAPRRLLGGRARVRRPDRTSAELVARYQPLPPFPAVVRDLSLVVARSLSWADLSAAVAEAAGPNLAAVEYLDTFQGGNLADDSKASTSA